MTAASSRLVQAERAVLSFFAVKTDGSGVAIFRICFGLLAVWQALGVWLNLERFYGNDGLIPYAIVQNNRSMWISAFSYAPESEAMLLAHAIGLTAASVCVVVGFFPRVATLLLAYFHLSLQFRNPFILNSGDRLFMIMAALSVGAPLANRLSLHSWARRRSGRPPLPDASMWGVRFLQLQIAYVYMNSVLAKIGHERWRGGLALRDVLASPVFAEWPQYVEFWPIIYALTWGTLIFEFSFPLFVWFKKWRPWLLLSGVMFHVGIDVLMMIPIFSYIMIVSYSCFLEDSEAHWLLRKLRLSGANGPRPLSANC